MGVVNFGSVVVSKPDGTVLIGQQTAANSIPVVLPSDIGPIVVKSGPYTYTPLGYQQITSLGSATLLTVPATATLAVIIVSNMTVRYRDDGVAPTTTVGMPVYPTQQITYSGSLSAIQFIQTAASAILDISYYK